MSRKLSERYLEQLRADEKTLREAILNGQGYPTLKQVLDHKAIVNTLRREDPSFHDPSIDGATSGEGDAYVSKSGTSTGDEGTLVEGFHVGDVSESDEEHLPTSCENVEGSGDRSIRSRRVPGLQPMIREHGVGEVHSC